MSSFYENQEPTKEEISEPVRSNKEPLGVKVSTFLCNLQQTTKKTDIKKY